MSPTISIIWSLGLVTRFQGIVFTPEMKTKTPFTNFKLNSNQTEYILEYASLESIWKQISDALYCLLQEWRI